MAARRRGEDIIDFSMGNPDGPTPPHIVEKLCTVAQRLIRTATLPPAVFPPASRDFALVSGSL
jgi:aspartate/methionine/tyrosine aminotransferase